MLLNWETLSNEFGESKQCALSENRNITCDSNQHKIFLSHRYLDKAKVCLVKSKLETYGYTVFLDWEEESLQDRSKVDKKVAKTILTRMEECDVLLFIITENFHDSLWMAWELGLFHGQKGLGRVALMPIEDKTNGKYIKTEFLQLYPYIDEFKSTANNKCLWVNDPKHYPENFDKYVAFDDWVKNNDQPYKHK